VGPVVAVVVVTEAEAVLREEGQAAVAAAFAPEQGCAGEEADEGWAMLVELCRITREVGWETYQEPRG
jgi:hypothetical protein